MRFRPAENRDIDTMIDLLGQLFALETDYEIDRQRQRRGLKLLLESSSALIVVADDEVRVVGMVTGQLLVSTAEGALSLVIEDLVVHSDRRGQGVGSGLLTVVSSWGKANGASRLQLLADCRNHEALGFYESCGWQRTEMIALHRSAR